jgi:hypothetical protein
MTDRKEQRQGKNPVARMQEEIKKGNKEVYTI